MQSDPGKFDVTPAFRGLLLDLTVTFLIQQPEDIIQFGFEYFTELKSKYQTSTRDANSPSLESKERSLSPSYEEKAPPPRTIRRKSVFAESYDPEDDDEADEDACQIYPKSDEQRRKLEEHLSSVLIFKSLGREQLNTVLDAMFLKDVSKGDRIINQGDEGDYFYIIESGSYNAFVTTDGETTLVRRYENAGSFGELALMYSVPRSATVQASSEGKIWALDRNTFKKIVLKSAFQKRKLYEGLLEQVPILSHLSNVERLNVADALSPKNFEDGELIMCEGDEADGMYFIESGTVLIKKVNAAGEDIIISSLSRGAFFGELALVTKSERAATAVASGFVELAFLNVEAFERLLGPSKELMQRNISVYGRQLEDVLRKASLSS